jgi:hypothetical protein
LVSIALLFDLKQVQMLDIIQVPGTIDKQFLGVAGGVVTNAYSRGAGLAL